MTDERHPQDEIFSKDDYDAWQREMEAFLRDSDETIKEMNEGF